MKTIEKGGLFRLGSRHVNRIGYGAMQLAGPGVFGPPKDRPAAVALLRAAVESGVNHIDTSDYYGPHITNQIIREALYPYDQSLVIVTKVGAKRDSAGDWLPATSAEELTQAVHDNLRNLGLDRLEVVNFRSMLGMFGPVEGSLEEPLTALAELQQKGLIQHIGMSNVTKSQVNQGLSICNIACVQNMYNLAHRGDDLLLESLASQGIAYTPFFPLGGFSPLQSEVLYSVASEMERTPMQVALAWLLQRSPNILLIPGTSSIQHMQQNIAAAEVHLSADAVVRLDSVAFAATQS